MRFYSKIVFICNLCFIASGLLRYVDMGRRAHGNNNSIIPLQPVVASIVMLALVSIFLNMAFVFIVLYRRSVKKPVNTSRFIIWFNLILLPLQVWYYFF